MLQLCGDSRRATELGSFLQRWMWMRQDKPGLSPLGHSLRLAAAFRCPLSIDKRTSPGTRSLAAASSSLSPLLMG